MLCSEKRAASFVVIFGLIFGWRVDAGAQDANTFYADLAFHFDCQVGSVRPEESIERFLKQKGFRVMNVVLERRKRKLDPMPQQLFIDAIDAQRRRIRVRANSPIANSYRVGLYTPPPTTRAVGLEDAILTFVVDELRCHVRQVSRNANGPEKRNAYDRFFRIIEKNFVDGEL